MATPRKPILPIESSSAVVPGCTASVAEPCEDHIELQYGAAYPLVQVHANGAAAHGEFWAEKGTITPDGTYIAPKGHVWHDEDTIKYFPNFDEDPEYFPQTFKIVLAQDLGHAVDPRAREYILEPLAANPLPATVSVATGPPTASGEVSVEDFQVVPIPYVGVGIEPVNDMLVVASNGAAGEYAAAGENPRILESANLPNYPGAVVKLAMDNPAELPPNPLIIAIGKAGIKVKCIPAVASAPKGDCSPTGRQVVHYESKREVTYEGETTLGTCVWQDSWGAQINAAVNWLVGGVGGSGGGGFNWNWGNGQSYEITANRYRAIEHERWNTYKCCPPGSWKRILEVHRIKTYRYYQEPAPQELLYFWNRDYYGWQGTNPRVSKPIEPYTKEFTKAWTCN